MKPFLSDAFERLVFHQRHHLITDMVYLIYGSRRNDKIIHGISAVYPPVELVALNLYHHYSKHKYKNIAEI